MGDKKLEQLLNLIGEGAFVSKKVQTGEDELELKIKGELKKHENNMNENNITYGKISKVDDKGNLFVDTEYPEITGIILNEDVFGEEYNPEKRSAWVGRSTVMITKKVDFGKREVYFSIHEAKEMSKEIFRQYLIDELKKGNKPIVNNSIITNIGALHNRVLLDLGGLGILAYVPIEQWDHKFINNVNQEIPLFSTTSVQVIEFKPQMKKYDKVFGEIFICSRKSLLPDIWEGIDKKAPVGTIFEVTCVDCQKNKWYGQTSSLPMDILCEYPNEPRQIKIEPGRRYKVIVRKVDEATKFLRAKVLSEIK